MVKDAQSVKYPATRTSQVTIWDVLSFQFDEASSPGHFAAGERFMVSSSKSGFFLRLGDLIFFR